MHKIDEKIINEKLMKLKVVDLEEVRRVYFIGIKGVGMVGLAEILKLQGKEVVGSDVDEPFFTDQILDRLDAKVYKGFSEDNISGENDVDLVIHSTAYSAENNSEMKWLEKNKKIILNYPEALGMMMKRKVGIAVCGSHGKTTTTAMLALLMKDASLDPTALIGSKVNQLDASVLVGKSDYLLIEADEYQNKLAYYYPQMVILTNLDFDHPDYFKDFEDYKRVFKDFIRKIPVNGTLVVWGRSAATLEVAMEAKCKIVIYGMNLEDSTIHDIKEKFEEAGKHRVEFVATPDRLNLLVAGDHNALNATAALAMSDVLGVSEDKAIESLNKFEGTSRRLEIVGRRNGALIIDDYAHHPEEIKATLTALRDEYSNKNLICVFHPHTFTRTKALLADFSQSFSEAHEVIILDIYGSAREEHGGVSSEELVQKMNVFQQNVSHLETLDDAYENLKDRIGGNDVLVTMGAGNVCDLANKLAKF